MERKYSISEIDAMRESVSTLMLAIAHYQCAPDERRVEDKLRTYLIAGVSPEELAAEAKAHRAKMPDSAVVWVESLSVRASDTDPKHHKAT